MKILRNTILTIIIVMLILLMFPTTVHAKANNKLTQVFGDYLSVEERNRVQNMFINHLDLDKDELDINISLMTNKNMDKLLGYPEGSSANSRMLSNVQIQQLNQNSGVFVEIITPDKITKITEQDYMNAAITAGLTDSYILVATLIEATGEAALAGIYQSAKEAGVELSEEQMMNAKEEMDTVSKIIEQNTNNGSFNANKFRDIITIIKTDIVNEYQNNDNRITDNSVTNIVNKNLNENNIIISDEQFQSLNDFFTKFAKSLENIDVNELKTQLVRLNDYVNSKFDNIKDYLNSPEFKKGFNKFTESAKDAIQKAEDAGFFAKIKEGFLKFIRWIDSLFPNNTTDSFEWCPLDNRGGEITYDIRKMWRSKKPIGKRQCICSMSGLRWGV